VFGPNHIKKCPEKQRLNQNIDEKSGRFIGDDGLLAEKIDPQRHPGWEPGIGIKGHDPRYGQKDQIEYQKYLMGPVFHVPTDQAYPFS
jgi:hypothetical protein